MTPVHTTSLAFQEGGSDKVYDVTLEAEDGGTFAVTVRYGRRGNATTTGTKGAGLTRERADALVAKCVNEKTRKGYQLTGTATVAIVGLTERNDTGLRPQLLTPVSDPAAYVDRPGWGLQEKYDGTRLMVRVLGGSAVGANRTGFRIALAPELADALQALRADVELDGELVAGTFYIFDLLAHDGHDLTALPYEHRYAALGTVLANATAPLVYAPLHVADQAAELNRLRARKAEGGVWKRLDAAYTPGRHATMVKLKFWKSASCIVAAHNEQRSVALQVVAAGARVNVGNVTVKANQDVPAVGAVVEVKYLYATGAGILFQPELLHVRTDLEAADCTHDQLVAKAA